MNPTGVLLSILFGFVPMLLFALFVYQLDRFEKEPILLIGGVFTWGAVIAASGAFLINSVLGLGVYLFTGSEAFTEFSTSVFTAPVIEELLKGFAVLIVFLFFRREFDSILDGIIYAAVTALGFSASENVLYVYRYGYVENGINGLLWLAFVRVILVGWQHPFYTAFTGIGLAVSRLSRNSFVKIGAPLGGLLLAIFTHAIHNLLAGLIESTTSFTLTSLIDWAGWLVMFLFVLWAIHREQRWMAQYLREEVSLGTLSAAQYRKACSAWALAKARMAGPRSTRKLSASHFYQVAGELAHKKRELATLGDESGNSAEVQQLRTELAHLSASLT